MNGLASTAEPDVTHPWHRESVLQVLPPEVALFFAMAHPYGARDGAARAIARGVSWERLAQLANDEGVLAQVHQSLQSCGMVAPGPTAQLLQSAAVLTEFRLMHVRQLLERTVAALQDAGIEVMLVKGAALATFVYGEFRERNMSDLDIVVPAGEATRAERIAAEVGWMSIVSEDRSRRYESHHHLPPLHDQEGIDVRLELHTDVLPKGFPLQFSLEGLRKRQRREAFGRGTVMIPSLEDMLLYSCVHLAWSHEMRVGGWKTFRDLSEIIRQPGFAWSRFVDLAADPSLCASAYWCLRLAARMSGVPVPPEVLATLRPSLPESILGLVERHFALQLQPSSSHHTPEWLSRLIWTIGMRPGRSGRAGIRPWQVVDRGETSEGDGRSVRKRGGPSWLRARGYLKTASYVRRLARPWS